MMVALVAGILAGCGPTTVPSPSGMPATEEETDSILRLDAPTSTADTHRTMAADSTATVQNEDTTEETASGSGTDTDSIANARRDLAASIDSLNRQLAVRRDTTIIFGDTLDIAAAEDSTAHNDTTARRKPKESGIDAPVTYTAKDSIVYEAASGNALLFGEAKVHYQNMDLEADAIIMNMDSSLVHAVGTVDSLGTVQGSPGYKQGNDTYESESMSFNFKTKRGFISGVKTEQGDGFLQSERSKRMDDGMFLSPFTVFWYDTMAFPRNR